MSGEATVMSTLDVIDHYHAHIYYDPESKPRAAAWREKIAAAFPAAVIGRWHDEPVGPHPISMYQVAFATEMFAAFMPWLMLNHDGLTILVHPGTGDGYADHTRHAAWLGGILPLRLSQFKNAPKPS
jgi:DOPA 4,5-dioxygenase